MAAESISTRTAKFIAAPARADHLRGRAQAADRSEEVGDALSDVSDALEDVDTKPEVIDKIREIYGFLFGGQGNEVDAKALLGMLATISKIAGTVAPVLLVVGFAIDVVKMLGFLNSGPSALEQLVTKRFKSLDEQFDVIAQLIHGKELVTGRGAINTLGADAADYINKLRNANPNLAQRETLNHTLNTSIGNSRKDILPLVDAQSWRMLFDPDKHSQVWGLMQHHLFLLPNGPAAPIAASVPPTKSNQFDHRLMVPFALQAGGAFLTALRAASPEYRTTGELRETLKLFATGIAGLAQSMREEVLSRTIYTAADFSVRLEADHLARF